MPAIKLAAPQQNERNAQHSETEFGPLLFLRTAVSALPPVSYVAVPS